LKVFGLIHARFLATSRGGQLLLDKISDGVYGDCPRYLCNGAHLMPLGMTDSIDQKPLKLFCGRCQQLYNCNALVTHGNIRTLLEGAYFGSSAMPMVVLGSSKMLEELGASPSEPFRLQIYGFLIHPKAVSAHSEKNAPVAAASPVAVADGPAVPKSSDSDSDRGLAVAEAEVAARNQKKRDRDRGSQNKEVDL
jgi:hypothetical protein